VTFFLRDQRQPEVPVEDQPDLMTFGEGVGAAWSTYAIEANNNFRQQRERKAIREELAAEASERLGMDPPGAATGPGPSQTDRIMQAAREAQKADPEAWADLDFSDEHIDSLVNERQKQELEDLDAALAYMPDHVGWARHAGGLLSGVADVRQLPLMLLGLGPGSILKVAGREAMLNAAGEALTLPSQFETSERLDRAPPDVAQQLAFAAAGGAILGGGAEALARGLRWVSMRHEAPRVPEGERQPGRPGIGGARHHASNSPLPVQQQERGDGPRQHPVRGNGSVSLASR